MVRTRSQVDSLRKLAEFVRPHWRLLVLALALMLLSIAAQVPIPLLTMYLVDHIFRSHDYFVLNVVALVLLGCFGAKALSTLAYTRTMCTFRTRVSFELRKALMTHIQNLPIQYFRTNRIGYLMSRITTNEALIRGLMAGDALAALRESLTLVAGIAAVFWLNWKLATLSLSVLPFYILWLRVWNPRVRKSTGEMQNLYAFSLADMSEALNGVYLIKAFTAEQWELAKMLKTYRPALLGENRVTNTRAILAVGAAFINAAGKLALIWIGGYEIMRGAFTLGAFIAFNSFLQYLFEPTQNLIALNSNYQQGIVALEQLLEIFDEEKEAGSQSTVPLTVRRGAIEFRNISFSYGGGHRALRGVNARLEAGTTVALVGQSGAGKTTLINLLMRYYVPESGTILIDGQDVSEVSLESLRRNIALVPQDPTLFSGDLYENILYGRPDASLQEVEEAARQANAHDFISKLTDRYRTKVGERGATLSGGERQRICLAMAFLKNAPILVLDEATSSLDSTAEREIQDAMNRLAATRTTLIIAHRLSTVMSADQILVLGNGSVLESGTHEELISQPGPYQALYRDFLRSPQVPREIAHAQG